MPSNEPMLDNGKVRIGAAVTIAAIVLAVQGAAFHQVLQIRDSLAEIKADQRVASETMKRLETDVNKLRDTSSDWVKSEDLAPRLEVIMLRNGYVREVNLGEEIRKHAPYMDDRAMILQRLEKLEQSLGGGGGE